MRLLVTRDDYYEAAMHILGTEGAGGIKIGDAVCRAGRDDGIVLRLLRQYGWLHRAVPRVLVGVADDAHRRDGDDRRGRCDRTDPPGQGADVGSCRTRPKAPSGRGPTPTRPSPPCSRGSMSAGSRWSRTPSSGGRIARGSAHAGDHGPDAVGRPAAVAPADHRADFNLVFNEFEALVLRNVPQGA